MLKLSRKLALLLDVCGKGFVLPENAGSYEVLLGIKEFGVEFLFAVVVFA